MNIYPEAEWRRVLRPGQRFGLEIADARDWGLWIDEAGALLAQRASGTTLIAKPGEVTRVVVVPTAKLSRSLRGRFDVGRSRSVGADDDVVAFLAGNRVVFSAPLAAFDQHVEPDQWGPGFVDASQFAGVLGLTLVTATAAEVRLVNRARRVFSPGPARQKLLRLRRRHQILLGVIAASLFVMVVSPLNPGQSISVQWLVLIAAALLWWSIDSWRLHRRFMCGEPDITELPLVPNSADSTQPRWVREAQLFVGPEAVVYRRRRNESWATGPAGRGVVKVVISADALWFVDRTDRPLLVVPKMAWGGADGQAMVLRDICRLAGIAVYTSQSGELPAAQRSELTLGTERAMRSDPLGSTSLMGFGWTVPLGGMLQVFVALLLVGGSLGAFPWSNVDWTRWALATVAGVVIFAAALTTWQRYRLNRYWLQRAS